MEKKLEQARKDKEEAIKKAIGFEQMSQQEKMKVIKLEERIKVYEELLAETSKK